MEKWDCAIVGGGAAGMSAALQLARARKSVVVFDNNTNRNRVTQESHGFLTRDGITPAQFREEARHDLAKYPNVTFVSAEVTSIMKQMITANFQVGTNNHPYLAEKVLLATGIRESFPRVPSIGSFYGKSIFSCPYCDGYERKDEPLILFAETEAGILHMGKTLLNWTGDLVIASNGNKLAGDTISLFEKHGVRIEQARVTELIGENGMLQEVVFENEKRIKRSGGFVIPQFVRKDSFAADLGCMFDEEGKLITEASGQTSIPHVYAAGEYVNQAPSSLLLAAAEGARVATNMNLHFVEARFFS
ncbi:NAD(P)/FAD-dependent oxidoreductase [Terribacillus sp. 179-K 1B1 HS]|uniref:NAD(P)/FAD-dependent oxidoreductase n=1 Tax=Terribacillus sp. 179-K 1B1 HS TaxID=3142388 RepID=UPI0039A02116